MSDEKAFDLLATHEIAFEHDDGTVRCRCGERQPSRHYHRAHVAVAIEALLAEAWEEGFDAGERDVMEHVTFDEPCVPNPYAHTSLVTTLEKP